MNTLNVLLLFCFPSLIGAVDLNSHRMKEDHFFESSHQNEALISELDDMKNLFKFEQELDPKDPSLCIESIAKAQVEEYMENQSLKKSKRKKKEISSNKSKK